MFRPTFLSTTGFQEEEMSESLPQLLFDTYRLKKAGPVAIERRRHARLLEMVAFARANSPYYRELYQGVPEQIEDPQLLPVTSKRELMAHFDEWVTDRDVTIEQVRAFIANPERIGTRFLNKYRVATTSGSTGTHGIFVLDERNEAVTKALGAGMQLAWLSLGGFLRVILGGRRAAMVIATGGHFAAFSRVTRQHAGRGASGGSSQVFSVHTPLPELVAQLNQFRPLLLQGYASVVALLADEQEAGRLHIHPVLVLPTSEGLADHEYDRLARTFHTKVGTFYGGTECGVIAQGCEERWLHLNSDWAVVEPVDASYQPVPPGTPSHTVLVSNLANRVQPILRYDMGDSVFIRPDRCPCGNPMPALRVQGRAADVLTFPTPGGGHRRLAPLQLATLFDRTPGMHQFQIVQTAPTALRVRIRAVSGADLDQVWQDVAGSMSHLLAEYHLDHVQLECAAELPEQSPGGKYRVVIPFE
jgi:phenylacetate-coenzyme A ligase PaaK-like adenylate-forming protein